MDFAVAGWFYLIELLNLSSNDVWLLLGNEQSSVTFLFPSKMTIFFHTNIFLWHAMESY